MNGSQTVKTWINLLGFLALPGPSASGAADDQRDLTSISLEELAQTKVTSVSKTEEPWFRTPAAMPSVRETKEAAVALPQAGDTHQRRTVP